MGCRATMQRERETELLQWLLTAAALGVEKVLSPDFISSKEDEEYLPQRLKLLEVVPLIQEVQEALYFFVWNLGALRHLSIVKESRYRERCRKKDSHYCNFEELLQ